MVDMSKWTWAKGWSNKLDKNVIAVSVSVCCICISASTSNLRYSTWWIILKLNIWCMPISLMLDVDDSGIKRFLPMRLMYLENYSSTNIWVSFYFSNSILCIFHLLCLKIPKILLGIPNILMYQNRVTNSSLLIITTISTLYWVLTTFRHHYLI